MYNKKNTEKTITVLEFEKIIDTLEKSCSSRIDVRKVIITFWKYFLEIAADGFLSHLS